MKKKLLEAMEYMDQKYIDEAVEASGKKRSYKPIVRWSAIAASLVLVLSLGFGYLGGWFAAPQDQIILPPTRYSFYQSSSLLASSYTLQDAVEQADAIAWVRIGNWLGEDIENHPQGKTYFEAEVVECYKGDIPETFSLKQYGSSKCTDKAFPLLTYGNELLLFLNVSEDTGYGNCYYIMGSYSTVIRIAKDSDGVAYLSTNIPTMGNSIEKNAKNLALTTTLRAQLADTIPDEIQKGMIANANYLFALEEIKQLLEES